MSGAENKSPRAVHFGAGNIGRGFIGLVLTQNGFHVDFVDIAAPLIDALKARHSYDVRMADATGSLHTVTGVDGINNKTEPELVVEAIARADLVTTAIGPKVLPFIAPLIARGLAARRAAGNQAPLDIIACENMIGASAFLGEETLKALSGEDAAFAAAHTGFPNAAVDCIVPLQYHDDPLLVTVEAFHEWVTDDTARKNRGLTLKGVHYVENLEMYIERKLFTVNTGHATTAYAGAFYGHKTILASLGDARVVGRLRGALAETGKLIVEKWKVDPAAHQRYIDTVVWRFHNPYISDDVSRVARTPVRKLGFDERFIRPIRELRERGLEYTALVDAAATALAWRDAADEESVRLQGMLAAQSPAEVIATVTGLKDEALIHEIEAAYRRLLAQA